MAKITGLISQISGMPQTVLTQMVIGGGKGIGEKYIMAEVKGSQSSVRSALKQLNEQGLIRRDGRFLGWQVTGEGEETARRIAEIVLESLKRNLENRIPTLGFENESRNPTLAVTTATAFNKIGGELVTGQESAAAAADLTPIVDRFARESRKTTLAQKNESRIPTLESRNPTLATQKNVQLGIFEKNLPVSLQLTYQHALETLHQVGIMGKMAETLAELDWVTPENIKAQAEYCREKGKGTGILIARLRDGDPMPEKVAKKQEEDKWQRMLHGEFAAFINQGFDDDDEDDDDPELPAENAGK